MGETFISSLWYVSLSLAMAFFQAVRNQATSGEMFQGTDRFLHVHMSPNDYLSVLCPIFFYNGDTNISLME